MQTQLDRLVCAGCVGAANVAAQNMRGEREPCAAKHEMVGGFHAERLAPERLDPLAVQVLQVFHIGHAHLDWPAHIGGDARIVPQEHTVFPVVH